MEKFRALKTTVRKERMNGCDPWDGNERSCDVTNTNRNSTHQETKITLLNKEERKK
jgi:hypothetical protein